LKPSCPCSSAFFGDYIKLLDDLAEEHKTMLSNLIGNTYESKVKKEEDRQLILRFFSIRNKG
jgi:hypothetical protein